VHVPILLFSLDHFNRVHLFFRLLLWEVLHNSEGRFLGVVCLNVDVSVLGFALHHLNARRVFGHLLWEVLYNSKCSLFAVVRLDVHIACLRFALNQVQARGCLVNWLLWEVLHDGQRSFLVGFVQLIDFSC